MKLNEQICHSEGRSDEESKKKITLQETAAFLLKNDNYLILTHRRPDGDTIGCAAALCRGLRAIGKTARIYENPQFTPKFAPYLAELTQSGRRDEPCSSADKQGLSLQREIILSVDVAAKSLFPFGMEDADVALAIDHHGSNEGFAAQTFVKADAAACGEIVWALLGLLDVSPTKEIAEAVYVAVSTDTGCFRYSNVTANTLRVAADCIACGADVYPINRVMFETKRWARLRLESFLVQTAEFYRGGFVAVCAIPNEILTEYGLTEDDIDDISAFARNIEGVQIGVTLREVEGGAGKISVRTGAGCDASSICRRLGGGGHPAAAGATVPGGIEAAKTAVLAAIEEELCVFNAAN